MAFGRNVTSFPFLFPSFPNNVSDKGFFVHIRISIKVEMFSDMADEHIVSCIFFITLLGLTGEPNSRVNVISGASASLSRR
jgi:hypothetical protein